MKETPAISSNLLPGHICNFYDKEHSYMGMVIAHTDRALQVISDDETIYQLNPARIVISSQDIYPIHNPIQTIRQLSHETEKITASLSAEQIWQKTNNLSQPITIEDIILKCGFIASDAVRFALFSILKNAHHLFKCKHKTYYALSQEESNAALKAEHERKLELDYHQAIEAWVKSLVDSPQCTASLEQSIRLKLETELFLHTHAKPIQWLNHIFRQLAPDNTYKEMLITIRKGLGQINDKTDRYIALSGLPVLYSPDVIDEADRIAEYSNGNRLDLSDMDCWTVDAEDSEDLDDAISIEEDDDGWVLGIHISDVSYFVKPGSRMDIEAQKRTSSIYLPDTNIHMLPQSVSCNKASLLENHLRPALSILLKIDKNHKIESHRFAISSIIIKHRFSYEEFDDLISQDDADPKTYNKISILSRIVEQHLNERKEKGAKVINDAEQTASRHLIAELMVIYNKLMAEYAKKQSLPFFYRFLEAGIASPVMDEINDELFIPASIIGLEPIAHQAMGLDVYAQLTSPIRRYADLINQRQITSSLTGKGLCYQSQDLEKLITHLINTRQNIRLVTHQSEQFRQMTHICETALSKKMDAVVIKQRRNHTILHIPDYNVRIQVNTDAKYAKGTKLNIEINKLNPESGIAEVEVL